MKPCESCRVSADRYRYGPCAMCAEESLQRVIRGDAVCGHCGRKLTRYVRVLFEGEVIEAGTTCAVKLIDEGATEVF